ncbi:MAG: 3-deoxy-7-phosphoheptulonate synthase [Elusimicrobia bacterium RIFOXYA2_FULL_39_19]|nr:MAG: 3-deoxy-7-phosphoheptulonate synthase [Elusimicrobia bacterium RIFOXYA2_FULL_39_19]
MILTLKAHASQNEIKQVVNKIKELGFTAHISKGEIKTIIGVIGEKAITTRGIFESIPAVETITPISKPYKLCSREFKKENSTVKISDKVTVGSKKIVVIAGPCSVESRERTIDVAQKVKKYGACCLRGGAFKPRTSPYAFQGLGEEGLKYLREAKIATGLPVVTEIMSPETLELVSEYADVLQIGARNMQNYDLLKEVGSINKPVLLKRGLSATVEELLMSAEYIMSKGNYNVILCERGIRTYETATRFTLDLNAVPVIKHHSHLPVIVDPSHGVGVRRYIPAMALAAVAAGADGLIIEVHSKPEEALCDGAQSLLPEQFSQLMKTIKKVAEAVGRTA